MPIQNVKKHFLDAQKGFSLIEIVLALFLIVSIAVILLTAGGSLFTTRSSKLQTIAGEIASKDIEKLRNTEFASLPGNGSFTDPDLSKLPSGSAARTISDYSGNPKIKHLTITISWLDDKVTKTYTTDTLIYESGL